MESERFPYHCLSLPSLPPPSLSSSVVSVPQHPWRPLQESFTRTFYSSTALVKDCPVFWRHNLSAPTRTPATVLLIPQLYGLPSPTPTRRHLNHKARASIPSGIAVLHWHTQGRCPISFSTAADAVHPSPAYGNPDCFYSVSPTDIPMQRRYTATPFRAPLLVASGN